MELNNDWLEQLIEGSEGRLDNRYHPEDKVILTAGDIDRLLVGYLHYAYDSMTEFSAYPDRDDWDFACAIAKIVGRDISKTAFARYIRGLDDE